MLEKQGDKNRDRAARNSIMEAEAGYIKKYLRKTETYKNFLGHVSNEETIFFKFIKEYINKEIKHKEFLINVRKSNKTKKNVYLVDGYLKIEEGLILIEYDGDYWHDEIYDDLKDEVILEIRKDILGIIRISSSYFEKYKEKIKIDILEATGRLSREYMIECYEKEIDKLAGDKLTENST